MEVVAHAAGIIGDVIQKDPKIALDTLVASNGLQVLEGLVLESLVLMTAVCSYCARCKLNMQTMRRWCTVVVYHCVLCCIILA